MATNPNTITNPIQWTLGIGILVVSFIIVLSYIGPKVTPYSRKQWVLLLVVLFVLWIPMGWYIIFVAATTPDIDPRHVGRVAGLNLLISVPLFIFIGKRILKK